jgi:hypothetical protein
MIQTTSTSKVTVEKILHSAFYWKRLSDLYNSVWKYRNNKCRKQSCRCLYEHWWNFGTRRMVGTGSNYTLQKTTLTWRTLTELDYHRSWGHHDRTRLYYFWSKTRNQVILFDIPNTASIYFSSINGVTNTFTTEFVVQLDTKGFARWFYFIKSVQHNLYLSHTAEK